MSDKLHRILDIWSAGYGVVSLQLFHNTTASEAFTREACLIEAIGKGLSISVVHIVHDITFSGQVTTGSEWPWYEVNHYYMYLDNNIASCS